MSVTEEDPKLFNWQPRQFPDATVLEGKYTILERLSPMKHGENGLFDAMLCPDADVRFIYLLDVHPKDKDECIASLEKKASSKDLWFFAIINKATGIVGGYISIMRIFPDHGVYEIGHVFMGPDIARTRISTEAVYLLLQYAFDQLDYRRVEWKCNALNEKSKSAALRFGFQFEGLFRKSLVSKGLNRDTAWFAILDDDWSGCRNTKAKFEAWLDESNFSSDGAQIRNLGSFAK